MTLAKELKLNVASLDTNHECLLSLVLTASMLQKLAERFFAPHGITDTQFNILMTLAQFGPRGLTQQELSEKLVVHKSNVTGLADRLEKLGYIERRAREGDRRCNQILLTPGGVALLDQLRKPYFAEVERLMKTLTEAEKKIIVAATAKLRQAVRGPK